MTGDELLARLLQEFGCLRDRSMGQLILVRCASCTTMVTLTADIVPPGELAKVQRDLAACIGQGSLRP
jgi:hypothetical protein